MYDQSCTREQLEQKLQDPGKFLTLDIQLSAALTRSAGGGLATRILNFKEQQSRKGIQVRGRYVLLMFEDYFITPEEAGSLYRVEDLLGIVKVGDTVQDLRRFVNRWDATLAGMATTPEGAVLRDILLRQIRPSQLLKYDIEVFDRASEKAHEKSYSFLLQSMKNLIYRERVRENRNRITEKNKAGGPKDTKAAPAKGDGRGHPNAIRGRNVRSNMCRMTSRALNHPEETEHDHPQKGIRMIRGRRCQKKKWQRPLASTMLKASADEVTSAPISTMTRLLLPPRTPRGRIYLHRRRRGRSPMPLHVWLIVNPSLHCKETAEGNLVPR